MSQKIVNFYFLRERKLIMLNAFASLKHSKNTSIRNDLSHGKLLPSLVVLSNPPKCNYVYVPGKIIRTFHVVDVERTSKKCTKTCNAPAELFFSCVNQLFVEVRGIVMPGARLTRLKIPNAWAKPATGQWVTHCSFVPLSWSLWFRAA